MNFLAHLFLSGSNDEVRIGNFSGDSYRRSQLDSLSTDMRKGVELHWFIDQFTDSHEIVAHSKALIRPVYRKYAPVLVDIYYDHFLALYWSQYHTQPLDVYAEEQYALLYDYWDILPKRVRHLLPYMKRDNWLANYAHFEGIDRVLKGMGRRAKFESKMEEGVRELKLFHSQLAVDFKAFFPLLVAASEDFLHSYPIGS